MELSSIRHTLSKSLAQLDPTSTWPVNVNELLNRLGLRLHFEQKASGSNAESVLQLGTVPTVVVYRMNSSQLLSSKERFSIAHEVAHWVVWRRFGFLPSSKIDRDHETLCNEFAADLLVPTRALNDFVNRQYHQKVNSIYFPSKIKRSASVSWDVAAKKIAAAYPSDSAYLQLVQVANHTTKNGRPSYVFKVKCSTVTNKPGSFVGQQGYLRAEPDVLNWMACLPFQSLQNRTIALTIGNLRLQNIECTVLREAAHWVIHFRPTGEGVHIS